MGVGLTLSRFVLHLGLVILTGLFLTTVTKAETQIIELSIVIDKSFQEQFGQELDDMSSLAIAAANLRLKNTGLKVVAKQIVKIGEDLGTPGQEYSLRTDDVFSHLLEEKYSADYQIVLSGLELSDNSVGAGISNTFCLEAKSYNRFGWISYEPSAGAEYYGYLMTYFIAQGLGAQKIKITTPPHPMLGDVRKTFYTAPPRFFTKENEKIIRDTVAKSCLELLQLNLELNQNPQIAEERSTPKISG